MESYLTVILIAAGILLLTALAILRTGAEEKKKLISVYFTDKEREKITEDANGRPLSLYIHHQTIYGQIQINYQTMYANQFHLYFL